MFFHEQDGEQLADEPAILHLSFGALGATDQDQFEREGLDVAHSVVRHLAAQVYRWTGTERSDGGSR